MRPLATAALLAVCSFSLCAQTKPPAPAAPAPADKPADKPGDKAAGQAPAQDPAAVEKTVQARAVAALQAAAAAWDGLHQFARSVALRRELLQEYDEDHAESRDKLGFVKVGTVWKREETKTVLDENQPVDAAKVKRVEQDWATTSKQLAKEHERAAEAWTQKGDSAAAARHWRRVLRFSPGEPVAAQALALHTFESYSGDEHDLLLLRHARAIKLGVDYLKRREFPVTQITDRKHPLLEKAGVAARGVASEHFEVWGNLAEAQLKSSAMYAERALCLCRSLFGTSRGELFVPARLRHLIFVGDRAAYGRVLDACAEQFQGERMQFLKEEVDQAFVSADKRQYRLCYVKDGADDLLLDQTVRGVAQDATMFDTHGLWEGIGHAMAGFFFGKTLTFLVEQKKDRTVTKGKTKALLPDIATWMAVAAESAWTKTDTPTSALVLIHAAKFTDAQRVKAWAMADYLLRWRPELLFELDASKTPRTTAPPDVEVEFKKRTKLDTGKLDDEWRDFWGKNAVLRAAMAAEPLGGKDEVAGARVVADAVNDARLAAGRGPIGWYVASSDDAKAVLKYLDDTVKAQAEQKKDPKKQVPLPVAPDCIGKSVAVFEGVDAAAAVQSWLQLPGARDRLLHPGRGVVGVLRTKTLCLVDLASDPAQPVQKGSPLCWPQEGQKNVAGAVRAADLGPAVLAQLAKEGVKPDDQVGCPLTLHFLRKLRPDETIGIGCRVHAGPRNVDGVLVWVQGDDGCPVAAPGVGAFVPLRPLPTGDVTIDWEIPPQLLTRGQEAPRVAFTVK